MGNKTSVWNRFWRGSQKQTALKQKQRDDIGNLFKDLGLDADQYKNFSLPQTTAMSRDDRDEVFIAPTRARPTLASSRVAADQGLPKRQDVPVVAAAPAVKTAAGLAHDLASALANPTIIASISALHSERSSSFALLKTWGEQDGQEARTKRLAPIVGLASYTGGVGKSALTASLGTAFALEGARALIIGQTAYSPLVYYFGGPRALTPDNTAGLQQYSYAVPGAVQPIDFVVGALPTHELIQYAQTRLTETAVVLMDMEASPHIEDDLLYFDMMIVPLRPDINALVTIERIERAIETSSRRPPLGVWYVLNQFDATRDLHIQVNEALRKRLAGRLLHLVIPLDNSVQEALASGQPPQIYRNYTSFAKAVTELQAWITENAKLTTTADKKGCQ